MEGPIRLKSDARAHLKSIIDLIESSRQAYLRFHAGRPSYFKMPSLKAETAAEVRTVVPHMAPLAFIIVGCQWHTLFVVHRARF